MGGAFNQGPVVPSVIIKSGDNSRTTHIISIIAFHIPKTQIVLNMCD